MSALVVIRRKMWSLQKKLMWVQMVGLQILLVKRPILVDPNAESNSTSTTPIIRKIDKMERLIIDGTATLVNDEDVDYGTNSLLEQWKES
ncbi:hypothetical protein Tco_0501695 [Tanacetum coccineum]